MAVKITVDFKRKFSVSADIDAVYSLISDIPTSASHFPNVKSLTPLENNAFRWEMEEISSGGHSIQSIYACQYTSDSEAKTVDWTPIKGVGNGLVSGKVILTESGTGTDISFATKAELTLPFPRLLKVVVSPIVKHEFTEMVDTYLSHLKETWG